jgi:hypothetical protein
VFSPVEMLAVFPDNITVRPDGAFDSTANSRELLW